MKHRLGSYLRVAISCVAVAALLLSTRTVLGGKFTLECDELPSPLKEIYRNDLEIDQSCGIEGNAGSNKRKRLENRLSGSTC